MRSCRLAVCACFEMLSTIFSAWLLGLGNAELCCGHASVFVLSIDGEIVPRNLSRESGSREPPYGQIGLVTVSISLIFTSVYYCSLDYSRAVFEDCTGLRQLASKSGRLLIAFV